MNFISRRAFPHKSLGAAAVVAAPGTLHAAASAPAANLQRPEKVTIGTREPCS